MTDTDLNIIRLTVHATLAEMGIKADKIQNGRIYRSEMVEVIGRRAFDKAVREGKLPISKTDPLRKTARVYAKRTDWKQFLNNWI